MIAFNRLGVKSRRDRGGVESGLAIVKRFAGQGAKVVGSICIRSATG
jgi:hypothetical protein